MYSTQKETGKILEEKERKENVLILITELE